MRERLTEREIDATHPLVHFIGIDAYTTAGSGSRRDLFEEGDAGTYLTDAGLLETLVRGKLDALIGDVRAEGYAVAETRIANLLCSKYCSGSEQLSSIKRQVRFSKKA